MPSIDELAEAGAHLGHSKNKCLPKNEALYLRIEE